jgi:hypothetical protein
MNAAQVIIGNERLAQAMSRARSDSLDEDLARIEQSLDDWRNGEPPTDDVSIVVIERRS